MSSILAARSLKMDNCQSLESFGSTGALRQCQPVILDFDVDNTFRCGPQPKSGKYGIGGDGFILVPYSQCFWKSAVVNSVERHRRHGMVSGYQSNLLLR
jgi:hypothetical protein